MRRIKARASRPSSAGEGEGGAGDSDGGGGGGGSPGEDDETASQAGLTPAQRQRLADQRCRQHFNKTADELEVCVCRPSVVCRGPWGRHFERGGGGACTSCATWFAAGNV
jgi:hypothetical protein